MILRTVGRLGDRRERTAFNGLNSKHSYISRSLASSSESGLTGNFDSAEESLATTDGSQLAGECPAHPIEGRERPAELRRRVEVESCPLNASFGLAVRPHESP